MEKLRTIVNDVLDQKGWRQQVLERMAVELWPEVAGENIARHTLAERFKGGILYIRVRSPQWTQELHFLESRLITRLNGRLRQNIVQKLRCRVTTPPGMRTTKLKPDWEDPTFPEAPPLPRETKPDPNDTHAQHARLLLQQSPINDPQMRATMERLIAASLRAGAAKRAKFPENL